MRYRRFYVSGGTYFFTVNLADRRSLLLVERVAELREVVRRVKALRPFVINAWVVLPDHIHAVWTLPAGDSDFSGRWRDIKTRFAKVIPATEALSASQHQRHERGIWQPRFWEHCIRDEEDYWRHLDYAHWNPMKHGYVQRIQDWPYSSFHRAVTEGLYPRDWCGEILVRPPVR
ncbi:REP-associated tyrosine transposase [Parathalassolituus penaei]|uniref:Transposase n=1 Tax=Parathalassolituus penaei TaxID=2997323 RepID=A0A9X3EEB9_9GAMM|nr:transposase [Parathalassolituus penaei]MCY0965636.1 transposase [Parathalassolituus penaei]